MKKKNRRWYTPYQVPVSLEDLPWQAYCCGTIVDLNLLFHWGRVCLEHPQTQEGTTTINKVLIPGIQIFMDRGACTGPGMWYFHHVQLWFSGCQTVVGLTHACQKHLLLRKYDESGRTLGVLLMSLGRKNGLMWRQHQHNSNVTELYQCRYVLVRCFRFSFRSGVVCPLH